MFEHIDPERFLRDYCGALGIDTTDLSPFTRYIIRPFAELYKKHVREYGEIWASFAKLLENSVDVAELPLPALNFLLNMAGVEPLTEIPVTGLVELRPTPEVREGVRFLSKEYEEGEVKFTYGGGTFVCRRFILTKNPSGKATGIAEFYTTEVVDPPPAGVEVTIEHEDFVSGLVLSSTPHVTKKDVERAVKLLVSRFRYPSFAANDLDLKTMCAQLFDLDETDIAVVNARHPLMYADLLNFDPPKHGGGIVDIYIPPRKFVDITENRDIATYAEIKEYVEAYRTHPYVPYASDIFYDGAVVINDTGLSQTFANYLIARYSSTILKDPTTPVTVLEGPIADIVEVVYEGHKLRHGIDWVALSVNRGTIFSNYGIVLIIFNTSSGITTKNVTITYTVPEGWQTYQQMLDEARYLSARYQLKVKVPIWICANVHYTGDVDFEGLQKEIARQKTMSESKLSQFLKKHGAEEVVIENFRVKLVSLGFGFFEKSGETRLEDFEHIVPDVSLLAFAVSEKHLSG